MIGSGFITAFRFSGHRWPEYIIKKVHCETKLFHSWPGHTERDNKENKQWSHYPIKATPSASQRPLTRAHLLMFSPPPHSPKLKTGPLTHGTLKNI